MKNSRTRRADVGHRAGSEPCEQGYKGGKVPASVFREAHARASSYAASPLVSGPALLLVSHWLHSSGVRPHLPCAVYHQGHLALLNNPRSFRRIALAGMSADFSIGVVGVQRLLTFFLSLLLSGSHCYNSTVLRNVPCNTGLLSRRVRRFNCPTRPKGRSRLVEAVLLRNQPSSKHTRRGIQRAIISEYGPRTNLGSDLHYFQPLYTASNHYQLVNSPMQCAGSCTGREGTERLRAEG